MLEHRKTVRHNDLPGQARELTFSCYQRLPLLGDEQRKRLLAQGVNRAVQGHSFRLVAFVFMPEHVHLIVFPTTAAANVTELLFAVKRPVSYRIKQLLMERQDPLLDRLTIRERPGKFTFRFWQEGPGYDRNLTSIESLNQAITYLHENPVRRHLCDTPAEWKWSSWGYYHRPEAQNDKDLPAVHGYPG